MAGLIWLWLFASLLLLVLLPLLFGQILAASLEKLHLAPGVALLVVIAVILGGLVNIPVKRIRRATMMPVHPLAAFGLVDFWPELRRVRTETVLAVNLGGCLIPVALSLYELLYLAAIDFRLLGTVAIAAAVNAALCYFLARPVAGIGITLPAVAPALAAAGAALLLAPEQAAPVAFIAGVSGPLIGADLLHLKDVESIASGVVSIGGAGTFDGIVLSGIIAAYLA
jgi:uncharacterized membrane protein